MHFGQRVYNKPELHLNTYRTFNIHGQNAEMLDVANEKYVAW